MKNKSEQIRMLDDLLYQGIRNKTKILDIVGLSDTSTNRRYIKYRLASMVKSSTTIENAKSAE